MNKHRLAGIADGRAGTLRVLRDVEGHEQIGRFIDICVTNACSGLDHRHGSILYDRTDQSCATARDQDIQVTVQTHHFLCGLTARVLKQLNRALRHTVLIGAIRKNVFQAKVRMQRFLASAQHTGVAGFQRQPDRIDRNIWTRFEDDADNAKRDSSFFDG